MPAQRHTKSCNKTDHQSHGHKTERGKMKAAVVATGNQTYTEDVSRGAMSISGRGGKGREGSGTGVSRVALKAKGGEDE